MRNAQQKTAKSALPKTLDVVVTLTSQDHQSAALDARICKENLAAWISSLVNTALKP